MSEEAKSSKPVMEKIPQAHGGALNKGGTPGNRGGTGRPPALIRMAARQDLDKLLPKLGLIARAKKSRDADKIRAIDVLARIGLDKSVSIEDVRAALRETTEEIRDYLPRDQADVLLERIRPIWLRL